MSEQFTIIMKTRNVYHDVGVLRDGNGCGLPGSVLGGKHRIFIGAFGEGCYWRKHSQSFIEDT